MRYHKRRGTLTKERIRLLAHFGFTWSVERPRRTWAQHFKEPEAFKRKHGHCRVPKSYPQNPKLGQWVSKMRQRKKHGRLTKERVRLLNGLGFIWNMNKARESLRKQKGSTEAKKPVAKRRKYHD